MTPYLVSVFDDTMFVIDTKSGECLLSCDPYADDINEIVYERIAAINTQKHDTYLHEYIVSGSSVELEDYLKEVFALFDKDDMSLVAARLSKVASTGEFLLPDDMPGYVIAKGRVIEGRDVGNFMRHNRV